MYKLTTPRPVLLTAYRVIFRCTQHAMRNAQYAIIAALLVGLALPVLAHAQTATRLTVNRLEAKDWPNVMVNVTLAGPDGRALPNLDPANFEVREQGQPQPVEGVVLGPARV